MSSPDKLSLHDLYSYQCPDCGGHIERLSISGTENDELQRSFNKAARWIFKEKKTKIQPGDINENSVQSLVDTINSVLQDGFNNGIEYNVPYSLQKKLSEDIYVFSGAKTYDELKELSSKLLDENSNIKPFNEFWKDAQTIHADYNKAYLEAEYIFATQSAQMASKWQEFETDGDRYYLQYRTANDDRVRKSHALLHDTTLPPSDPFWDKYYPPNGWRCRCTVVQVRKNKYPESNSTQAMQYGADATKGKNNIFQFNPGKQKVIFPKHHPYFKQLTNTEHQTLEKKASEAFSIKTADDVVKTINTIAKDKNWFERGFKTLNVTRRSSVNGSTDMDGRISLNKQRMDKTISGINKLSNGKNVTFDEADAMSTFWHEITHNRNKKGNTFLTNLQTRYMELANEFVSRNTLTEFYDAFGVKIQHPELMTNRKSTGYNTMVNNYQKIISKTKLKKDAVVESVKKHLFNESYTDQKTGLTNALKGVKKADGTKLKKAEINSLIQYCDKLDETNFEKYLDKIIH